MLCIIKKGSWLEREYLTQDFSCVEMTKGPQRVNISEFALAIVPEMLNQRCRIGFLLEFAKILLSIIQGDVPAFKMNIHADVYCFSRKVRSLSYFCHES